MPAIDGAVANVTDKLRTKERRFLRISKRSIYVSARKWRFGEHTLLYGRETGLDTRIVIGSYIQASCTLLEGSHNTRVS